MLKTDNEQRITKLRDLGNALLKQADDHVARTNEQFVPSDGLPTLDQAQAVLSGEIATLLRLVLEQAETTPARVLWVQYCELREAIERRPGPLRATRLCAFDLVGGLVVGPALSDS